MAKFNIGDVVELNSGGPEMVVTGYENINAPWSNESDVVDKNRVWCKWYHPYGNNFERSVFNTSTLESVATYEPSPAGESGFQIGDIVVLNAEGGPDMTVSAIQENTIQVPDGSGGFEAEKANDGSFSISCTWWNENGKTYQNDNFHYQTITKRDDTI